MLQALHGADAARSDGCWTSPLTAIESHVAESGKEAVALLTRMRCCYCCVVLDLKIPPPDGIEVTKFIYQQCRDLPVVVVSGHSDLTEGIKNAEFGSVVEADRDKARRRVGSRPVRAQRHALHPRRCSSRTYRSLSAAINARSEVRPDPDSPPPSRPAPPRRGRPSC